MSGLFHRTTSKVAIGGVGVAIGLVVGVAGPAVGQAAKHLISGSSIKKGSIAGNRLKSHTITTKQLHNKLVWHNLKLVNSWGPQNTIKGDQYTPAYALSSEGIVYFRGRIADGTQGTVAFTLPAAARPAENVEVNVGTFRTTTGQLYIDSDGAVTASDGYNGTGNASDATVLDGVSFAAGS